MSMSDPTHTSRTTTSTVGTSAPPSPGTEVRGRTSDTFDRGWRRFRETKPSFMTSELWLMLAGVAALIITYNVADEPSFDLWRTTLLCVLLGSAYIVSRGFAKAGSHDDRVESSDEARRDQYLRR